MGYYDFTCKICGLTFGSREAHNAWLFDDRRARGEHGFRHVVVQPGFAHPMHVIPAYMPEFILYDWRRGSSNSYLRQPIYTIYEVMNQDWSHRTEKPRWASGDEVRKWMVRFGTDEQARDLFLMMKESLGGEDEEFLPPEVSAELLERVADLFDLPRYWLPKT